MAEIVFGVGASHSPLLNSPPEDYPKHAEIDASGRKLLDKRGRPVTYGELLAEADPAIKDQIKPEVLTERSDACTVNIGRLDTEIAEAGLDALIVVGDDQNEQYGDENMPAILIYRGETIANNPLQMAEDAPDWWRHARSQFHVKDEAKQYPVAYALGGAPDRRADGRRIRYRAGAAAGQAAWRRPRLRLRASAADDEEDRADRADRAQHLLPAQPAAAATLLRAGAGRSRGRSAAFDGSQRSASSAQAASATSPSTRTSTASCSMLAGARTVRRSPPSTRGRLNSGTSEIRNWITVAGACERLDTVWQEYIPCYRSAAGTGCGMGFAVWR